MPKQKRAHDYYDTRMEHVATYPPPLNKAHFVGVVAVCEDKLDTRLALQQLERGRGSAVAILRHLQEIVEPVPDVEQCRGARVVRHLDLVQLRLGALVIRPHVAGIVGYLARALIKPRGGKKTGARATAAL